jgi:formate dehydrogenase subunit delta
MPADPLVKMANQIAASVPDREHASVETAQHIHRFWTPAMIHELVAHVRQHPTSVLPEVSRALSELEKDKTDD